jgi:hydroxymethylglutaryl-CoA synthase
MHACYGATAALLNAANWVEGAAWDGRRAVVVASDSAVYAPGPARATSGAGAVALLVGPDAPLALERGLCATHFTDATDFFKPSGLFPVVDGPLSVASFLQALDATYDRFGAKFAARHGRAFTLEEADHVLFHSPYNKLVQKAFARLAYLDMCRRRAEAAEGDLPNGRASVGASGADAARGVRAPEACTLPSPRLVIPLGDHPLPPGQVPRELEQALLAHTTAEYERKVRTNKSGPPPAKSRKICTAFREFPLSRMATPCGCAAGRRARR